MSSYRAQAIRLGVLALLASAHIARRIIRGHDFRSSCEGASLAQTPALQASRGSHSYSPRQSCWAPRGPPQCPATAESRHEQRRMARDDQSEAAQAVSQRLDGCERLPPSRRRPRCYWQLREEAVGQAQGRARHCRGSRRQPQQSTEGEVLRPAWTPRLAVQDAAPGPRERAAARSQQQTMHAAARRALGRTEPSPTRASPSRMRRCNARSPNSSAALRRTLRRHQRLARRTSRWKARPRQVGSATTAAQTTASTKSRLVAFANRVGRRPAHQLLRMVADPQWRWLRHAQSYWQPSKPWPLGAAWIQALWLRF